MFWTYILLSYCIIYSENFFLTKTMNFDRCLSNTMEFTCTLKTSQISLAYKTYLTELFHTNACPLINQKYFSRLHTDSILKLQPCLNPGGCLLVRFLPMLEQQKTMRKVFFSKLGSEQRCHRLGSDKWYYSGKW